MKGINFPVLVAQVLISSFKISAYQAVHLELMPTQVIKY